MSIKNIMFIGQVFQIEVSAGLAHSLKGRQNVNLCCGRAFTGAHFFRVF